MTRRLAVLGGEPSFPAGLPFARPAVPPLESVVALLEPSYSRGTLTNGPLVRRLEDEAAEYLNVPHVVAVSSCTSGMMLVLRSLGLAGPVVMPSFTFSATAHAAAWNGLDPIFAECDERTFQLDVADAAVRTTGAAAIMATHVFGSPCPVARVEDLGRECGLPVVFDAAHAMGARLDGAPVGSGGDAEIFSLSPTKPLVAGEGGLVATRRDDIAASVRIGRDYGNPGDYDTRFVGLNARLSELHAAVALESLRRLDDHLEDRRSIASWYQKGLTGLPGIAFQERAEGTESTWKDITIIIDADRFGVPRGQVVAALRAEGIDTRCYFDPPVHRQRAYASLGPESLPVTERLAQQVLSLPVFAGLTAEVVETVVDVFAEMHVHAGEVCSSLSH